MSFNTFSQEVNEFFGQIDTGLSKAASVAGDKQKAALREVQKTLDKAQSTIRQMEDDLSSVASADQQGKIRNAVKNFKSELQKKKNELKRIRDAATSERDSLLGNNSKDSGPVVASGSAYYQGNNNGYDENDEEENDYRKRLLKSKNRMDRSNQTLEHSIRMIEESNDIGQAAAAKLGEQGEQIKRTANRVQDMNADLASGSTTIGHMQRRQITNKIIIVLVILGLLLVIVIILGFIFGPIIYKLIQNSKSS